MSKTARVPIATLIAEYQAGASTREIGARHDCSYQNIAQRLRSAGVVMRPTAVTRLDARACPTCGVTFQPRHSGQVYCKTEHVRHKTTCVRGHALTEENRYHFPSAQSRCKECAKIRGREYRKRKKARRGC